MLWIFLRNRKTERTHTTHAREIEKRRGENFYRLTSNEAKAVNGYSNMRPCSRSPMAWLSNFILESFNPPGITFRVCIIY